MQNFNINLNVRDTLICNCCKQIYERDINVTSTSQTITLLNGYILSVISVTDNRCTVLIQNGSYVTIRNIYNFETQICLQSSNCNHILALSCSGN